MPIYATNKKAHHEYEILDSYEAGLVLSGPEVKAIRSGQMKLTGAYVTFHNGEAYLLNAHISKYKNAATIEGYDPTRSRKLLLRNKEIAKLSAKSQEKGLTIVPLKVYTKGRHIKVEVAVGRGKKLHDKRRSVKEREQKRAAGRAMKGDY